MIIKPQVFLYTSAVSRPIWYFVVIKLTSSAALNIEVSCNQSLCIPFLTSNLICSISLSSSDSVLIIPRIPCNINFNITNVLLYWSTSILLISIPSESAFFNRSIKCWLPAPFFPIVTILQSLRFRYRFSMNWSESYDYSSHPKL